MNEALEQEFKRALMSYVAHLHPGHHAPPAMGSLVVINVDSPITVVTVNNGMQEHKSWLAQTLHLFENSSIRIAICIISMATLIGFVAHKLGYLGH